MRTAGAFGSVILRWTVYTIDTDNGIRSVANDTDISPTTGILTFGPADVIQGFSLAIRDDSIPELAELLEVELSLSVAINGARLDNDSIAMLEIAASDDPFGVLRIADSSTIVSIAEDVSPENSALGQVQIRVNRVFGTIGSVQVLWEIIPLSVTTLPDYVDLLFFGSRGVGVSVATSRPNTATTALRFSGLPGSVVTVPREYHPSNISQGFTMRYKCNSEYP